MSGRLFPPRRQLAEGEVDLRAPLSAFGRYDLLEKIGESASSEVFVARSDGFEGLFRLNALKRMRASLCSDVLLVSRFIEEARLAVRVEHSFPQGGTVAVDDFGKVGGVYFIAFELLDGITAEELIHKTNARGLAIDPRAAAYVVRQVARSVETAWKTKGGDRQPLRIVHGDLQPRHVHVLRDGRIKLRGFSAPSLFASTDILLSSVTPAGAAHMAPEVLRGAPPTTTSDVWSLGVMLYELVTGRRAFFGDSIDVIVEAVTSGVTPKPSEQREELPSVVDALVQSALGFDPEDRPQTVTAWCAELDAFLGGADYDDKSFATTLLDLDADDPRGTAVARQPTRSHRVRPRTARIGDPNEVTALKAPPPPSEPGGDSALADQLKKDPGVWGLVRLAERFEAEGKRDEAKAMFRTAAVLFASKGLLAHALCAYDGARQSSTPVEIDEDLERLAILGDGDPGRKTLELRRVGGVAIYEALRAHTDGGVDRGPVHGTPFLSALSPEAFSRLGALSRVRRVRAGAYVLREGEPGDSLFAIGDGRLIVSCTPSTIEPEDAAAAEEDRLEHTDPGIDMRRVSAVVVEPGLEEELQAIDRGEVTAPLPHGATARVFLSALTAGDLFGEFSFLTGRPRSASVEAVTSCRVLEITKRAVGTLLDENPSLRDALEAFYKERVLEWMLAKNEVFSLLEPDARRQLLAQCGVYDIPAGKMVVREGELHDAMYFIKKGEVEVSSDDGGVEVFINKLGPGEFFGEIAALEGGPRRASVRAVTDLEVFRITREDLAAVLQDAPDVRERLLAAMRRRSDELKLRIEEQRQVLAST